MISEAFSIPESVADLIAGRTPLKVGARHYSNLLRKLTDSTRNLVLISQSLEKVSALFDENACVKDDVAQIENVRTFCKKCANLSQMTYLTEYK